MSTPKKELKSTGFMGDVSHGFGFVIGKTVAVGDWIGRSTLGHLKRKPREQAQTPAPSTVREDAQDRITILEERMKHLAEQTSARLQEAQISVRSQNPSETPKPAIVSVPKKSAAMRRKTKAPVKKTAKRKVPVAARSQPST